VALDVAAIKPNHPHTKGSHFPALLQNL